MPTGDPNELPIEQRVPMLSDRAVKSMQDSYAFLFSGHEELNSEAWLIGALDIRKVYEAKITSGELMVVKTARRSFNPGGGKELWQCCGECRFEPMPDNFSFCPGCGAKIIE